MMPPTPRSTLFPYTTLFRSHEGLTGLVAEQMRPIAVAQVDTHPRFKYFREIGEDAYKSFLGVPLVQDRKSTRLNSSHRCISYAVFCLKKKTESRGTTSRYSV